VNRPPRGFVSLKQVIPDIRLAYSYHRKDNLTGAQLAGYGAPGAWLRRRAAMALARVQRDLASQGLGLLVFDAYRPVRGTRALVAWARRAHPGKKVVGPYVALRSKHNLGIAIDLTLCDKRTGKPLDMGSGYDAFGRISHTFGARGRALKNRLLLKRVMERRGFKAYLKEWWHFNFPIPGARARDVPYGCQEAGEAGATGR
jgi:D-alanyl-D-alanine dipeptidase